MSSIKNSPSLNKNCSGQCLILSMIFLSLFMILFMKALYLSRWIERKIDLQNAVDATLYSLTTYLGEGLNEISRLNQKLIYLHRALLFAQAGTILTGNGGVKLTEEIIRNLIRLTAEAQDMIKEKYPMRVHQQISSDAKKNSLTHYMYWPLSFSYPMERDAPRNGLPYIYRLIDKKSSWNIWSLDGFLYRASYQTHAKAMIEGHDLKHDDWKGVLIE